MIVNNFWVYYLALGICAICGILMTGMRYNYSIIDSSGEIQKKNNTTIYILIFIMIGYIIFFAAIRNGIIDTGLYIKKYIETNPNKSIKSIFSDDTDKAPLWTLYRVLLKKLGVSWHFYLGSISVISGLLVINGIYKYSDDAAFSCYLFYASMVFFWMLNGVRQFMVVSIVFASFKLITDKKLVKFMILILIMYFIHKSAIVLIPIYFIVNMKNWRSGIVLCILVTVVLVALFPEQINEWLDDGYEGYAEATVNDDGVSIFRVLVSLVTPMLAFVYRREIATYESAYINCMVNMSLITAGLYLVGMVTSGIFIGRLPGYTEIYNIILLPFIIKRVIPKNIRPIVWVGCIVGYFLYFHLLIKDSPNYAYTTDVFKSLNLKEGLDYEAVWG